MMQNDVVVVGGGISGLSLAFYCVKAGLKTTLLEKNDAVGGSFASPQYSADRNAKPNPTPKPDPKEPLVPIFDPDPQPLDDGGAPKVQVPFWPAWLSGTGEDESKVILVGILALLVLLPWRKKV